MSNPVEVQVKNIAVLIPCYNEEKTVAGVVQDFRAQLPDAAIYVYDNNSKDRTAEEAKRAGRSSAGSHGREKET
jgi:glycosyltransferase involved in cell wall biosynthesis